MSKPSKDLFRGTMGALKSGDHPEDIIAKRIAESGGNIDLREHPLQQSQLSAKQRKDLREKRDNRTMTAEEWKRLEWDRRFRERRLSAVDKFWTDEKIRLLNGQPGTRNWSPEQIRDILNDVRPKYNGKTMEGHHTFSAKLYPHLANLADLIYPATKKEHIRAWHGGNYKKSLPGRPMKRYRDF